MSDTDHFSENLHNDHNGSTLGEPRDLNNPVHGERRLHLKAFDYWLQIKEAQKYPLFHQLSINGLAPFRATSLLIELGEITQGDNQSIIIRFCGSELAELFSRRPTVGDNLRDHVQDGFAGELIEICDHSITDAEAAEFEFSEGELLCRGTILPLSKTEKTADYLWIVVSFQVGPDEALENDEADENAALLAGQGSTEVPDSPKIFSKSETAEFLQTAKTTIKEYQTHQSEGFKGLYEALAEALALYERGEKDKDFLPALFASEGLRAQKRAPFTPILKLIFGKSYDKTRLTEYAAALNFALRNKVASSDLVTFLENQPGGIKGCVKEERALKSHGRVKSAGKRLENAKQKLRDFPGQNADQIKFNSEFALVLARRDKTGQTVLIDQADIAEKDLTAILQKISKKRLNKLQ